MERMLSIGGTLIHKYLDDVVITSIEGTTIEVNTKTRGKLPQEYHDLGKMLYFEERHINEYKGEPGVEYIKFCEDEEKRIKLELERMKVKKHQKEMIIRQEQETRLKKQEKDERMLVEDEKIRLIRERECIRELEEREIDRVLQGCKHQDRVVNDVNTINEININGNIIKYIYDYIPYSRQEYGTQEEKQIMELILNLKYNPKYPRSSMDINNPEKKLQFQEESIRHFLDIIIDDLDVFNNGEDVVICNIPSSKVNNSHTGTYKLVQSIVRLSNSGKVKSLNGAKVYFGGDNLIRYTEVASAHDGGERSIHVHLNSIKTKDKKRFEGNNILLIDDVLTTGYTMLACKEIIIDSNPASIECLVLGKTIDINERNRMLGGIK